MATFEESGSEIVSDAEPKLLSIKNIASTAGKILRARLPWAPIIIMAVVVICAIFAPLLAPHDPTDIDIGVRKLAPGENWSYPLGTDRLGRDMLSRLIYGARTSAFISLVALGAGAVVGTTVGLVSGYAGKWTDTILMRITDAAMGFPTILAAMIIVTILGAGIANIILAIAVTVWARFARMIRGEVLQVRNRDFVLAARITGVSPVMIIWRHIFPNVINTLLIILTLLVGQTILLEASLSFLGLGLAPGASAWGLMVAEGRDYLISMWWLSLLPGLVITMVVMAFNFFGDWLRDTLDPKLRRSI
ncbi:MAG: ABC transporter permease [SAR202 cluster bacterium]|nr:ABC transporter permease [SAR202 cluster bacterium]